ncbi:MAG: single-stranded-DNA-specific exonuclease RecJ [Planctomycetota bacterium]|nr:single-stranded-DNA-specific exonuclease RecJ [Planctomycetota bacterium]
MRTAWTPRTLQWKVAAPFDGAAELAREAATTPLVGQILHKRGVGTAAEAKAFLDPKLNDLLDPETLPGVVQAAKRIAAAARAKEKIVIYGDYDVDGMTAVAILQAVLKLAGAASDFYVPHRLDEGYGLNSEAVDKIVADGAKLIVTVDCGISAVEPVARARAAGVDVIVTDHHTPGAELPAATAIVHPALAGGGYGNPNLSGAGVSFKLAWQVARELCGEKRVDEPMRKFLLDATCLAALGTIADVVPLVGENRVLAVHGLRGLPASDHPGLKALLASASLGGKALDAFDVGFALAPRLNACGRMGHARDAVELLSGPAPERCAEIARQLADQNAERQRIERQVTQHAIEKVRASGKDVPAGIVLADESWHGGVIGICAARLVETFGRPTILIATNGVGARGSGRSVPGFNLVSALTACSEHLAGFGGHAMAGGVRIEPGRIEAFAAAFAAYAAAHLPDGAVAPTLAVDADVSLAALNLKAVTHIAKMAPFGEGNPEPVVVLRGCRLMTPPQRMGRNGATVSCLLTQNDARIRAVGFGMGDLADLLVGVNTVDVAGTPVLNTFNGRTSVELHLKDVQWK